MASVTDTQAKITLSADDQATAVLQRAAQSFEQLEQGTRKAQEGMSQFNLASVAMVATGVSAANVLEKAVGWLKNTAEEAVRAADRLEAMHNRAQVIFGTDFPRMEAGADALGLALHRSGNEVLGFETSLAAVTQGLGVSKGLSEEMSQSLTGLAVDFGKVFHIGDDQAANSLQMALEGSTRALRQYGIVMSTAALQEYAHAEGIGVKVSHMNEEQQAILRYHFLMDKTHAIQEAAAKDTGNLDDSVKHLEAAWNDLLEKLGTPLTPVIASATEGLATFFSALGGELTAIGNQIEQDKQGLKELLDMVSVGGGKKTQLFDNWSVEDWLFPKDKNAGVLSGGGLTESFTEAEKALGKNSAAVKGWAQGWKDNSEAAGTAAAKALEKIKGELDNLNQKYEQASNSLADKLGYLKEQHESKVESIKSAIESLQDSLKGLKESFKDTMDGIVHSEEDALTKASDKLTSLKQKLEDLQLRATQESRRGSVSVQTNNELERTQKELAREQASYTQHFGEMTPEQQAAVKKREGETTLDRSFDDEKAKAAKATEKFAEKQADLTDKIGKKNAEMDTENRNYEAQAKLIKNTEDALKSWHTNLVYLMEHAGEVTAKVLKNMQAQFAAVNANLASFSRLIGADKSSQAATAAPAAPVVPAPAAPYVPTGYDLANPNYNSAVSGSQSSLLARDRAGQTITINMGGVVVQSAADIDALTTAITRKLQLQSAGVN